MNTFENTTAQSTAAQNTAAARTTTQKATALVIVDVQNDFCEGGSLAVEGGLAVAAGIAQLLDSAGERYGVVAFTQDFHHDPGEHFAREGETPDYATSWPVHCRAGEPGSELVATLQEAIIDLRERGELSVVGVRKGAYEAAYSGFQGTDAEGTLLGNLLSERGIERVVVCGIATDYCVKATVLDALAAGFAVELLPELCAAVAAPSGEAARAEMIAAGAIETPGVCA